MQMQRLEPDSDDSASEPEGRQANPGLGSVSSALARLTNSSLTASACIRHGHHSGVDPCQSSWIAYMPSSFMSNSLLTVMHAKHGSRPCKKHMLVRGPQQHIQDTGLTLFVLPSIREERVMPAGSTAGTTATITRMMTASLMTQRCTSSLEVTGTSQNTLASTSTR